MGPSRLVPLLLVGCGPLLGVGPRPIVEGPGFYDRPFPDDRRTVSGAPDLSGYPHLDDTPLLQAYIDEASRLDGFGTTSPIHLRFDGPLDPDRLPSMQESCTARSSVLLVDIDADSPSFGRPVPFLWQVQAEPTRWQPENLLTIQPVWGVPLRAATRYAVLITRELARPPRGFDDELESGRRLRAVRDWVFSQRSDAERVELDELAYAFTFTTQDPSLELARIVHRQQGFLDTGVVDPRVHEHARYDGFSVHRSTLRLPQWQRGEPPFHEGGAFTFDDGWPELVRMEEAVYGIALPDGTPPSSGWPLVLFLHGTGSTWESWQRDGADDIAGRLADRGIASLSVSLPLHGDRSAGGIPELITFNLLNPESARTNFRQSAAEIAWLAQVFTDRQWELETDEGRTIALDPDRVAYMGHSQGAVTGAIAAPFLPPEVTAVVLSGAGGGLSVSAVQRDAGDIDIQALLAEALSLEPGEELSETHPVIGLVQMLGDATDPLNYAPHWHQDEPWWPAAPRDVLMFEGTHDPYTPSETIRALAGAGGQPHLGDRSVRSPVQTLQGLHQPGSGPFEQNLRAWDGGRVTGGVLQYPGGGHFVVFQERSAEAAYLDFLESALDGAAVVHAP